MSRARFDDFDSYWLAYLGAHSRPATRTCHYVATVVGLGGGSALSLFVVWWGLPVVGGLCYALALASHPLFQGNRPFARASRSGVWRATFACWAWRSAAGCVRNWRACRQPQRWPLSPPWRR